MKLWQCPHRWFFLHIHCFYSIPAGNSIDWLSIPALGRTFPPWVMALTQTSTHVKFHFMVSLYENNDHLNTELTPRLISFYRKQGTFRKCNAFTQVAVSSCEQSWATDAAGHTNGGRISLRPTNRNTLSPVSWWGSVLWVGEMLYRLRFLIIREVFLRVTVYSWLQQTKEVMITWEMASGSIRLKQILVQFTLLLY